MQCVEHKKRDGRKRSSLHLFHGFYSSLALPFSTCLHIEKGVTCFTYQAPQDTYPMCPHALLLTIPCHTEHLILLLSYPLLSYILNLCCFQLPLFLCIIMLMEVPTYIWGMMSNEVKEISTKGQFATEQVFQVPPNCEFLWNTLTT